MSRDRSCLAGSMSPVRNHQSEAMDEAKSSNSYCMAKCRTVVLLVATQCENRIGFDLIRPTEWHVCCEEIWYAHSCLRRNLSAQSVHCKAAHEQDER